MWRRVDRGLGALSRLHRQSAELDHVVKLLDALEASVVGGAQQRLSLCKAVLTLQQREKLGRVAASGCGEHSARHS